MVLAPWKILHSEIPFRLFLLCPVFSVYTCEEQSLMSFSLPSILLAL